MDVLAARPWICLALALLPAAVRYARGRRLVRAAGDPLLSELWVQRWLRPSVTDALPLALAIALAWDRLPLILASIALWMLGRLAAVFPLRRALFGETWSLFGYLAFAVRIRVALQLAWLGVLAAPGLVLASPPSQRGPVAGAIVAVLLTLFFAQRRLLRLALHARPCERPDIVELCRAVAARSHVAGGVLLYEGGPPGGRWANALALPAVRAPGVLFSRDLLDALAPIEVQAIFAHEVAHLEHFDPARLRRTASLTTVLIVLGAVLIPVLATAGGAELELALPLLWAGGLLLGLVLRARRRRPQETASDLRALALGADPEALIRGLTTTYALARIPRRLDPAFERRATHPSLARRIQDLRRAAQLPPPPIVPRAFAADDGSGTWVEFAADRLHWLSGVPVDAAAAERGARAARRESFEYGRLHELRVTLRGESAVLRAADVGGAARELLVKRSDLSALQATLDGADAYLGLPPAPTASPVWERLLGALAVAAVAVPGGSWALALAGLGALLLPGAAAAAALCAGFAGSALLLLARPAASGPELALLSAGNVALACVALAFWRRDALRAASPRAESPLLSLLGLGWFWAWAVVAAAGSGTVALHALLRESRSAVLAPLLMVAACAASRSTALRRAAWIPGAAASVALLLGSTAWRELWIRDPLLAVDAAVPSRASRDETWSLASDAGFDVPLAITGLALAPDGEHYLAQTEEEAEDEPMLKFWLGRIGSAPIALDAVDAIFLDATHVLALRDDPAGGTRLAGLRVEAPGEPAWTVAAGALAERTLGGPAPSLGTSWSLLGRAQDHRHLVLRRGRLDGSEVPAVLWDLSESARTGVASQWLVTDTGAFGVRRSFGGPTTPWRSWMARLLGRDRSYWTVEVTRWRPGAAARDVFTTAVSTRCMPGGPGGAVCLASLDGDTAVWVLEGDARRRVAVLAGEVDEVAANRDSLLVARRGGAVEVLDLVTGSEHMLRLPVADAWPVVGLGERRAAVAVGTAAGSRVLLYSLPGR